MVEVLKKKTLDEKSVKKLEKMLFEIEAMQKQMNREGFGNEGYDIDSYRLLDASTGSSSKGIYARKASREQRQ